MYKHIINLENRATKMHLIYTLISGITCISNYIHSFEFLKLSTFGYWYFDLVSIWSFGFQKWRFDHICLNLILNWSMKFEILFLVSPSKLIVGCYNNKIMMWQLKYVHYTLLIFILFNNKLGHFLTFYFYT